MSSTGTPRARALVAKTAALRDAQKLTSALFVESKPPTKRRKQEDEADSGDADSGTSDEPGDESGEEESGSEMDTSDEEREQRSILISATVKNIYAKLEGLEHAVETELKPLAYATLERMEKLEALLVKHENLRKLENAPTPDYLEFPGQREMEVVTGMGWGDQTDRQQRRARRVSRDFF